MRFLTKTIRLLLVPFAIAAYAPSSQGHTPPSPVPQADTSGQYTSTHEVRLKHEHTTVVARVEGIPYLAGAVPGYKGSVVLHNQSNSILGFTYKTMHCVSDVYLIGFQSAGSSHVASVKDVLEKEHKVFDDQLELEQIAGNRITIISFTQGANLPKYRIFLWLNEQGKIDKARFVKLTRQEFLASRSGITFRPYAKWENLF